MGNRFYPQVKGWFFYHDLNISNSETESWDYIRPIYISYEEAAAKIEKYLIQQNNKDKCIIPYIPKNER